MRENEQESGRNRDAGWVELLAYEGSDEPVARGHLMIGSAPQVEMGSSIANRAQLDAVPGVWNGIIESLHVSSGDSLAPASYRLRLESSGEVLEVTVGAGDGDSAPVESLDGRLPSVVLELGGH